MHLPLLLIHPLLLILAPAHLPGTDPIRHPACTIKECDAQLDQLQQVHITLHLKGRYATVHSRTQA